MGIAAAGGLLAAARAGGYALGYFEAWNLESLQGVMDALEETRSPALVGFSGDFMRRPGRRTAERLNLHAALARQAAQDASVPCATLFNECPDDEWTRAALQAGFGFVGVAEAGEGRAGYAERCRRMAERAHRTGAAVEAELGELPCGVDGRAVGGDVTDPDDAAAFARATGVDALAVSVGNVHVLTRGRRGLDLARLEAIARRVETPLVLHGGSGIADDDLRAAVRLGVAKVNYGTFVKQRCLQALRRALAAGDGNPHDRLAGGGPEDLLVVARLAVRDAVRERLPLLGCVGRAPGEGPEEGPGGRPSAAAPVGAARELLVSAP